MTSFHRSALARVGAVALLAAGGLATAAAPAQAADQADLALVPISENLALGVKAAKAKPFKFIVNNTRSSVAARDVRVTVETKGLTKRVGVVVPDGCDVSGTAFTCLLGDLAGGTSEDFGIPLFSTGARGKGGALTVTITSATADPNTDDNSETVDVTVTRPGYDLTSWVQDGYANVVVDGAQSNEPDLKPIPRGATAPLDWAIYNDGSRRATGVFYTITLPAKVSFAKLPENCVEQEIRGLAQAFCEDSGAVLRPGEYYTDDVRVKVAADADQPVLRIGELFAYGLDEAQGAPESEPQVASAAQRRAFTETDEVDNQAVFDVFVDLSAQPTPTPTPTPTSTGTPTPGSSGEPSATTSPGTGGGGGGLPVTGAQAGLIGGVGGAVLLAGGALLVLSRRRRVLLVTPGDEKSND
ncbi:LPXTG cell wall anchor domain-containing protein [Micromonospora sp. NBC_01655]|uniref:LPXTG cell wall anchor domain-containing protein n=1 Tax=Micromonospora sp. NBC_01655 TaxID=2975983 RepID=UPI00225B4D92|nr:LPXTG cell wall anchor domain-containing protein [Micromonospora sp. NBC_01655]MCX4468829.1 LPXTG cell wall anchor domain-containing protein [Micromonospora sp. NBC_01655]